MRRILIDRSVQQSAEEFANVMIKKEPALVGWYNDKMPKKNLARFIRFLLQEGLLFHSLYVFRIYAHYRELLVLQYEQFDVIHKRYFEFFDGLLNTKIDYDGKEKEFYKHIIDCMRYADIRSDLMRYYMQKHKVKACVYCNAQYAITTDKFRDEDGEEKRVGTYQFDHFYPESKYPYLCTSFFNLQPSCPTCNDSKNIRNAKFNLYTTDPGKIDVFWFDIEPLKKIDEYAEDDMSSLYVELKSDDPDLLSNHLARFHINQLYSQHTDVLQRLIVILKANSRSYVKSLNDSLEELFPNGVDDPEYFFFGYYMKPEHIHYQPLSKMVQDVVRIFRQNG